MLSVGTPPISVRLRRSTRARRLTLRLSPLDGVATLTIPTRVSERKAQAFLNTQEGWLRTQLARAPERNSVALGGSLPFLGVPHTLIAGRKIQRGEGQITVPPDVGPRLQAYLKLQARNHIAPMVDHYAAQVQRRANRLSFRDTRSRWGSCSSGGNLMFSWRLIMAPEQVLEYVVAHEVAHLVEMNHSAAFWQVVAGLMPDYKMHRDWLRTNGAALHAIDFTA